MSVATGTLGVNAAFLQEIKQENRDLKLLLARATELLGAGGPFNLRPRDVARMLEELRDQIALHFALEEAYGYFEDAIEVAPQLSSRADTLRGEHETLFLQLCALADRAEALAYQSGPPGRAVQRVAEHFREFYERFRQHEDEENALILQAFDDDLGEGD